MGKQYIFRSNKKENFTIIDNSVFDTNQLSLGAIGLVCLILSKPKEWVVRTDYFAATCKEGEKAIRTMFKELAQAGYMMRVRERAEDGTLRTVTLVADQPIYRSEGTPEERVNGYSPTPPLTEGRSTEGSVDGSSVDRGVGKGEVLVSTDVVSTEIHRTDIVSFPATQDATPQQEMFGAVCEAIGWDYKTLSKADAGQVAQAVGILRKADYTVDDIRTFMVDVWFKDWRWEKNNQHPTLKQLRQEIGKIRSVLKDAAPQKVNETTEMFRKYIEKEIHHGR